MPWIQQFDDTFQRANGAPGNNWIDDASAWSISSNQLTSSSTAYGSAILERPLSESLTDQQSVSHVTTAVSNGVSSLVWIRKQQSVGSGYVSYIDFSAGSAILRLGIMTNGSGPTSTVSSGALAIPAGTAAIITLNAVGTTITASVALASAPGTALATITLTDSTYSSGVQAVSALTSPNTVTEFTTYKNATESFTISPSTIPSHHVGNITLTLTGTNTNWTAGTTFSLPSITGLTKVSQNVASGTSATVIVTTGTGTGLGAITDNTDAATANLTVAAGSFTISPTKAQINTMPTITVTGTNKVWTQETASTLFSVSGGTGTAISSISVTGNNAATFVLTVGSAIATLTITDNSDGTNQSFTVDNNPPSLSALSVAANDSTGITLSGTVAGGNGTITTTLYRSTLAPFTPPGEGTFIGSTTGASPSIKDTSPGTANFYRMEVVDIDSQSALSVQDANFTSLFVRQNLQPLFVGLIGDSIGHGDGGSGTTGLQYFSTYMGSSKPNLPITLNNQSVAGTTSTDWQPGGSYYPTAKSSFASTISGMSPAPAAKYVFIQLGTNDTKIGSQASKATYKSNMANIANDLVAAGYTVILNAPLWIVPPGPGSTWDESANPLLCEYRDAISELDNGSTIRAGWLLALEYFNEHVSQLNDGVHPLDAGYQAIGRAWAEEFERLKFGGTTSSGHIFGSFLISS